MSRFPTFLLAGALVVSTPHFSLPLFAQTPNSPAISPRDPATFGIRREAGNWLFNGAISVAPGENIGVAGGPVFIANLRREQKNKLPLFRATTNRAPLFWATMPLPDFRTLSAPNYDFAALQTFLTGQVSAARTSGRSFVGWSLPVGVPAGSENAPALTKANAAPILKRLRSVLDAVAPDSALVLDADTTSNTLRSTIDIDALAASCDAILLRVGLANQSSLWPLKVARRVAEEQKDFDLPIFVAPFSFASSSLMPSSLTPTNSNSVRDFEAQLMEFWMGGATGFVLEEAQTPSWAVAIARNPGLFTGAVTLEDAAVLPSMNPQTLRIVSQLRAASRVPLVGRLPADDQNGAKNGESLFAVLDDQTSLEALDGLDKAARSGGTIYLEGLPDLKNKLLVTKMSDMSNATLEILPVSKKEVLSLSDPWLFGTARGLEIGVTQRLKWTLKTSLAAQARKKKGESLLEAVSVAKLSSDENGLLMAPLGKGRILWLAHAPSGSASDEVARRTFYAAIAGNLQGALANFSFASVEESFQGSGSVHLALRASKLGTPIVALFNRGASDATVLLSARSDATIALDLITEREIAATVSGYSSNLKVTVPAQGFAWLTFGATRAALDKERRALRPKARILK